MYPYYQVTKPLDSHESCMGWYEWMMQTGAEVAIVRYGKQYTLWCRGEEAVENAARQPNQVKMLGEIIQQTRGF